MVNLAENLRELKRIEKTIEREIPSATVLEDFIKLLCELKKSPKRVEVVKIPEVQKDEVVMKKETQTMIEDRVKFLEEQYRKLAQENSRLSLMSP